MGAQLQPSSLISCCTVSQGDSFAEPNNKPAPDPQLTETILLQLSRDGDQIPVYSWWQQLLSDDFTEDHTYRVSLGMM